MDFLCALAAALLAVQLFGCSAPTAGTAYDRDRFGSWADEDGDCRNTRHELLEELSSRRPGWSRDGCRVVSGRWYDPYTGKTFTTSSPLDVDHVVPLAWAWNHGADQWTDRRRRRAFALDARNLQPVDAGLNRSKGSSGPLEWLPPNIEYRCEYVLRFRRIIRIWELDLAEAEAAEILRLSDRVCE